MREQVIVSVSTVLQPRDIVRKNLVRKNGSTTNSLQNRETLYMNCTIFIAYCLLVHWSSHYDNRPWTT